MGSADRVQKTPTNPTGLKLKRVTVGIPVETITAIERIANERNVHISAVYREALQTYVMDYIMKGTK